MATLQQSVEQIKNIEELIANHYLMIDEKNYHVAMLAELWNLYHDKGKKHLCQNILTYCHTKNAFKGVEVKDKPTMLISIKGSDDNVEPYAHFQNGKIKLYKK